MEVECFSEGELRGLEEEQAAKWSRRWPRWS
jgi:hypothetical protein